MPRYLTLHTLACLTRQGADQLAARMAAVQGIRTRRVLVNLYEGKMLVEFEVGEREDLEAWLSAEGVHYDWLMRVELESFGGKLEPVP